MRKITVKTAINDCSYFCDEFEIVEGEYNGTKEKHYECKNLDFCSKLYKAMKNAEESV